jgi:hypothetical protein
MTIAHVLRLRKDGGAGSHLRRFEFAFGKKAKNVLETACPECGAAVKVKCTLEAAR